MRSRSGSCGSTPLVSILQTRNTLTPKLYALYPLTKHHCWCECHEKASMKRHAVSASCLPQCLQSTVKGCRRDAQTMRCIGFRAGKVPVLVTRERGSEGASSAGEERTVYESLICNEYLEDAYPEAPPLLPAAPADRARARIIMDRWNSRFTPHFYRFLVRQARLPEVLSGPGTVVGKGCDWSAHQQPFTQPHPTRRLRPTL